MDDRDFGEAIYLRINMPSEAEWLRVRANPFTNTLNSHSVAGKYRLAKTVGMQTRVVSPPCNDAGKVPIPFQAVVTQVSGLTELALVSCPKQMGTYSGVPLASPVPEFSMTQTHWRSQWYPKEHDSKVHKLERHYTSLSAGLSQAVHGLGCGTAMRPNEIAFAGQ